MRVIAGTYRGRTLRTIRGLTVRPATGRVRQTIFDTLTARFDIANATVLDLFAGSGSLGIEALSRGAARAVFVERDPATALALEANLRALGCEDRAVVVAADGWGFLERSADAFDIVFADPPYSFAHTARIPDLAFRGGRLRPGGCLLIEHETTLRFASTEAYSVGPEKTFGRTIVTFFRHPSPTTTNPAAP